MRPVSGRRRRRDAIYPVRREQVWDRAQGWCEATTPVCTRQMEQVHHKAGRTGDDPHRLSNLLGCCASCHSFIHGHPRAAYDAGWSVRRNGKDDA